MLPAGFQWVKAHQYEVGPPTSLMLDGVGMARMLQRVDGSWFARLDCHKPITAPLRTRDCASFESGVAGCEAWACRHEERLRAIAAVKTRKLLPCLGGHRRD